MGADEVTEMYVIRRINKAETEMGAVHRADSHLSS